jgi:murein DD-endopeptidase MepM/ murein hydrolase activator NlpD
MRRTAISIIAVSVAVVIAGWPSAALAARTAGQVAKDLAAARAEVTTVGRQYDRALLALENTESRLKATDKRLIKEEKGLAAAEALLNQRVETMYRNTQDADVMTFLLGATTFEDFVTRGDLIALIGEKDAGLVKSVKDTRATLQRNKRDLAVQRKAKASELATFKKKRAALLTKLSKVQGRYDSLLAELAEAMAREKAAGISTYAPRGPNGMVFPVRGVHYYSNTWGAARSGGRHHKGTDIMAPRGAPVVAIMAGVARVHQSGLGGKSITITSYNGWQFYYAHLNGYAIRSGPVQAGQLIGFNGSTGNARGGAPHVHFQMGPRGRWINPYSYLRRME